jgi:hypothetical protein
MRIGCGAVDRADRINELCRCGRVGACGGARWPEPGCGVVRLGYTPQGEQRGLENHGAHDHLLNEVRARSVVRELLEFVGRELVGDLGVGSEHLDVSVAAEPPERHQRVREGPPGWRVRIHLPRRSSSASALMVLSRPPLTYFSKASVSREVDTEGCDVATPLSPRSAITLEI